MKQTTSGIEGSKKNMTKRAVAIAVIGAAVLLSVILVISQAQVQVGYATLTPISGNSRPTGTALFTYSNADGVIMWQAGVAAVEPIRSGRIFVDQTPGTRSAIALANPSDTPVTATFVLRDNYGQQVGPPKALDPPLPPHGHVAKFVDQLIGQTNVTIGSLSFETGNPSQTLAAITLRESQISPVDYIYATLPVVDLDGPTSTQPVTFPHVALGAGYTSQIILISRSSGRVSGKIRLIQSDGTPFQLQGGPELPYAIQPNGTFRLELTGGADLQVGYALVTLEQGDMVPSGTLIFQYRQNGRLSTEAGVGAIPATTKARIFIDRAGSETGIAIANPGNPATTVVLELLDRLGGSLETTSVDLPAGGHIAKLAFELFPDLPSGFSGICEIRSTVPVVPITLKLTTNQLGNLILTTLPVADLTQTPGQSLAIFPQIAFGGGYSTRLILINTDAQQNASGTLRLYQSSGDLLNVPLAGQTGSQFGYQVLPGALRQLRPGNLATAQDIILDPGNPGAAEIAVNEGNRVSLVPVVIDSDQSFRDDFQFSYAGVNPEIASVDAQGRVQALKAGFSSLAISAGNVVKTGTITVAHINSGTTGGYEITGVTQDLSHRVYLANTKDQVVLRMQNLAAAPERFAGISQTPGLKNDQRLLSLFQNPAFLSIDQASGIIYVSDTGNNVIRRVSSAPDGRVDTLPTDTPLNSPQGVALDAKGYLWVADSGNHVIRRVNLSSGKVDTIAGQPGSPGLADGTGAQARFNAPTGIAVETETLAQQVQRELTGAAPPPVSVIVADTGNNLVRRVTENGKVVTLGTPSSSPTRRYAASDSRAASLFSAPSGVATDPEGNIYVTEPQGGQIKIVLASSGQVVPAAQARTFSNPRGVAVTQSGRVLIGTKSLSGQEIAYGQPVISAITPQPLNTQGGTRVTISGKNFSPETVVIVAGTKIDALNLINTETIAFTAPGLRSGRSIVSVQNRGGLAQTSILVQPPSLASLPAGSITTVAGGTTFAGEGAAAATGSVNLPFSVTLDARGNLYVADTFNNRVRRVDALTGIMTTVAGTGTLGWNGVGGLATAAELGGPQDIAVDASGNLFIADTLINRICRVDAKTGILTTVAGDNLYYGFSGDGGPAVKAWLLTPKGIWVDATGNLYIADTYNNRIRKVDAATGIITTIAGTGDRSFGGDNGPAIAAALNRPEKVARDSAGNVYVSDSGNNRIRRIDAATQVITTIAGNGQAAFGGDGGDARLAGLNSPAQLAFDVAGNLFVSEAGNARIREITKAGTISTVAGSNAKGYGGDGGPATGATLADPSGVAVDGAGQIFIADTANYRIRVVGLGGVISTVAGNGHTSFLGDNGPAWGATLLNPWAIAADSAGNLYIADQVNLRIRRVDAGTGIITTVAGSDQLGYSGDGGPATQAGFSFPQGVAVDPTGNIFIADTLSNRIRKVDAATKIITTVAGNGQDTGSVDGVPATQSAVVSPTGIAFDLNSNLLIVETDGNKVRKVDRTTGIITTIAGSGVQGFAGDGGLAVNAQLNQPKSVAVDSVGDIFIADNGNNRVRIIIDGKIYTIVGDGLPIFWGEGGLCTAASIAGPISLAFNPAGNLFVAGTFNRVARVDAQTLILTSIAGTYDFGFAGDGGTATNATFLVTSGLAFDPSGNLYVADQFNGRIRAIRGPVR